MGIQIMRIGHIGILVSDFERSFKFYTEIMGCKVTNRRRRPDGSESAFLRFDDTHHDFVIATAPAGVDVSEATPHRERLIQQIAFQVENRDEFMRALAHLHTNGVEIINGPTTHGIESGGNIEGSGSRSFYFCDPDGNRLEIFTDGMKVPNGEEFPRAEYADAIRDFMEKKANKAAVPAD
ncbi:MAG: VOC family protein [Chloroflexi bacterium]|nr:VOC family protein [Chloroflexota bacterium]MCH8898286.1 VOC family protein [Chloroflexota bacterium]